MSGPDKYTGSAPPLGYDQAKLDALLKKPPGLGRLTGQILAQNTHDKWTGQGYGSVYANARNMAQRLINAGITKLEDFGQRQVNGSYEYYNKATGQAIGHQGYDANESTWAGTFAGDGSTAFKVQFNSLGMPIFYTQYGGDTSDWGSVAPILTFAAIIPSPIQPFAQAINAVAAYRQGNEFGAVLSAIGAAYSFGAQFNTIDPTSANYINSMDAASDAAAGVGSTSTFTSAANWIASNAGTIRTVQQAVGVLNALDKKNLAGIIAGITQIAPQVGITVPESAIRPIQIAALGSAVSQGDWVGASMIGSSLFNSSDLKLASDGLKVANAVKSGNPLEMLDSILDFNKTYKVIEAENFRSAARSVGLPMGTDEASRLLNAADGNKELALYKASVDKAKRLYKSESGIDLPDEFFEANKSSDFFTKADDLYTTKSEAKNFWRQALGYEPSEFDLMELEGLSGSDVRGILDQKSTTTYDEAESILKNLYGSRYTPSEDEIINLMGLKEIDARKQATQDYNVWAEDKNKVTNDELTEFLKNAGLKEDDLTEDQLLSALKTTEAGAETYLQRLADIKQTTFDGSGFASQTEAQNAAIKNGYNTYTWEGKSYSLMSPEQAARLEAHRAAGKNVGVTPDIITPVPGKTLEQQLQEAGNPDEYAYMQGDHVVVVSKRMAVPDYEDAEAWAAFKAEKKALGGDNFQSYLTEKFSILEQAMKGAPEDSVAKMMASAAMWGYGKIANLAQTMMSTAEAGGMDANTAGKRIANQVENWSKKLVSQGVQNAEAAVFANIAAVTKESIAASKGVPASEISDVELYYEKSKALLGQVKDNPLGVGLFVSGEAVQEIPFLAVSGGVGRVFASVAGKTVGMSAALGTDVALNGAEAFGGNYAEVRDYLIRQGVPESKAHAAAVTSGVEAMGVSMITSYIGDRQLVKAFMGEVAQDSFGKLLISNSTKEWLLGNVEGYLQNASAQIGKYGEFKFKDEAINAGIMEGLAQKGIAAGVITADALSNIIVGKDADGNNVTYQDVITGKSTFDPATLNKNISFGAGLNLGDAIDYHSTFISNPDITPDEYFSTVQAMQDLGVESYSPEDIVSVVGGERNWTPEQIVARTDSFTFDPTEASDLLKSLGISNPTQEQINQFTGFGDVKQQRQNAARYADAQTTSEDEARLFFKANGIENPTPEQLAMFVGEKPDAEQRSAINAYADPLVTSESEARAFFRDIGILEPTQDQLASYVGVRPEADAASEIQRLFGTPPSDTTTGGQGTDTTTGGQGTDTTAGGEGTDTTTGGGGTDTTTGGQGTDTTTGGEGVDTTTGAGGADTTTGGQGADTTTGGSGQDTTTGGSGQDTTTGGQETDQLTRQDIIDIINGAIAANPGVTEAQVQEIIDNALLADDNMTAAEVQSIVDSAVSSATAGTSGQISNLEAQTKAQYDALSAAQKATADALVAQGASMQQAIASAQQQTQEQIGQISADVQAKYDSLSAEQKALADQLRQQGVDLNTAIDTAKASLQEQIGGVSADLQAKYNALTAEQKALANQLTQQGFDLNTAINTVAGQITADVQAKYDSLNAGQKALADQLAQQGVDLRSAIDIAAQQTQQQVMDLGTSLNQRVDQLVQQGMDQYTATQQAIAEVNQQNQQLQNLVGTQGRTATQSDIDALTQMLSGQRQADLTYDVNRDNQITQDDLAFLQSVVAGTSGGWKPPVGTVWGGTGLYGQIAANEAQRLADLQAAEAKRQQDLAAQEALQRDLARRSAIQVAAGQGQAQVQQLMTQIPQAVQAMQSTTTPIYGQGIEDFDLSSPLDVGFFKPSKEKQGSQTGQQATKIATGGYLDDLLDLLR